jgi:hypothetical protein
MHAIIPQDVAVDECFHLPHRKQIIGDFYIPDELTPLSRDEVSANATTNDIEMQHRSPLAARQSSPGTSVVSKSAPILHETGNLA